MIVLHSAQTLERYRVDMLNSGYYIVLINSHEDIFRYISGHAVLDEDDQDRAENVTRFFLLSPSESSVFQVCTEKITVYRINLLKVQKLVRAGYSSKWIRHISNSMIPSLDEVEV